MICPCCGDNKVETTDADYVKNSRYPKHKCLECGNGWDAMSGRGGKPRSVTRECAIFIRKNDTGEQRTYSMDISWDWDEEKNGYEFNDYWFSDGNASCDCNRELFFLRAGGEDDPPDKVNACGQDGYTILRIVDCMTHATLYTEE